MDNGIAGISVTQRNNMEIIVQKYGGSSVASIEKLLNCAENIRNTVKTGKKS